MSVIAQMLAPNHMMRVHPKSRFSTAMDQTETCGRFTVSRSSSTVKHVGNAVVVFDKSRVVPLYEASAPASVPLRLDSRW